MITVNKEPTMDDILGSIRRILSEDEEADRALADGRLKKVPKEFTQYKEAQAATKDAQSRCTTGRNAEVEECLMREWSAKADLEKSIERETRKKSIDDDEEALMKEWAAMAGGDGEEYDDAGDDMAAEWEVMLGCGPTIDKDEELPRDVTRVLNQDEIETLLGFDDDCCNHRDYSGIQAILNSALVSYERLPMLEVVFDRLCRELSNRLRQFTNDNVEVSLDNILSLRFGDYINSIPLPAMLDVWKAEEWDGPVIGMTDSSLIYSIVDILLGGRRGTAAMRIEGRPYTTIERDIISKMNAVIFGGLAEAFKPISPITFTHQRLETNPRSAIITRNNSAVIVAKLRFDMEDRGGRFEIVLPYSTLEPVRELLLQMYMGEKFGKDSIWQNHIAEELLHADTTVEAFLSEETISWGVILESLNDRSKPLQIHVSPASSIIVKSGDHVIARGKPVNVGAYHGVEIQETIFEEDE